MAIETIGDMRKAGTPEIPSIVFPIPRGKDCRGLGTKGVRDSVANQFAWLWT